MTVFYTSDLHLGHRLVAKFRYQRSFPVQAESGIPEEALAWHDDTLAEKWDATVGKEDVIWVLGDLSLTGSKGGVGRVLSWIAQRPGRKHLIPGNHDPVHPLHRDSHKWQRVYLDAFESVQLAARRKFAMPDNTAREVLLSHLPYGSPQMQPTWEPDEWRELPECPGYLISPYGQVRGRTGRILTPYVLPSGYHQLHISGVGKKYVHRLVALAYHGRPGPGLEVAHCNGDKDDNRAVNLRWATRAENCADSMRHGTQTGGSLPGEMNPNAKLTGEQVAEIRASSLTVAQLREKYGVGDTTIRYILMDRSWRQTPGVDRDYREPREEQWRLRDEGSWLLHGHLHGTETLHTIGTRQLDIGLDAWGLRPVSEEKLIRAMAAFEDPRNMSLALPMEAS